MNSVPLTLTFGMVALTALLVASTPATADLETNDPFKSTLHAYKESICAASDTVVGAAGPLEDPADRAWLAAQILDAAHLSEDLLEDPASPLLATPEQWVYWAPLDVEGMDLAEVAYTACERACEALEAYCRLIEGDPTVTAGAVSRMVWEAQGLLCHVLERAGIRERP